MAEETRLAVLSGRLYTVPKPPSRIVRIFLSSTFGDTNAERNYLYETTFPLLTKWCLEKHLDFQVVDMRWGIKDEATDAHMTTELCVREIQNCQKLSIGPNFMFFLGQRYGYRALQPCIKAAEFEVLLKCTDDITDAGLLREWYVQDDNAVPPVYLLLPITNAVKNSWSDIRTKLTLILRRTSRKAAEEGLISERAMQEYFISVTEEEVRAAMETPNVNDQMFGVIRLIHNLTDSLTDPLAGRYCDLQDSKLDEEAKLLSDRLKGEYVPSKVSPKNLHHYEIDWTENGVDVNNDKHVQYLQQFCANFMSNCKKLIQRALDKAKKLQSIHDPLFEEVVHQAEFCNTKCQNFCGRKGIIEEIFTALKKKEVTKPLVVHGPSGAGKTSIMAMIAKKAQEELGQEHVVMIRFLGTTPDSSSIAMVIQSICRQIITVYGFDTKFPAVFDQFTELVDFFKALLKKVSNECNGQPLLILLDSLDQLASTHNAYQCRWLVRICPPNVRIVLSTLPELHGILDHLKKIIVEDECFFPVKALPEDTMDEILDSWMADINRKVTEKQKQCIRTAFSECPQPIFLKLAFEQARFWHSYTEVNQGDIATTVHSVIGQLFERLEKKYGVNLVSHALGYIVAARDGLTQQELEDVLSLDDTVLDEIYQYHLPPNLSAVRIPALVWTRLKYELQEYMVDRQADGKTVSVLYHRQFTEAAVNRYLSDPEVVKARHQLLAEYFEGKWSKGVKKQLRLTHFNETLDADRTVPEQPLKYTKQVYNYRKLNELPYHLLYAHNVKGLIEHVFGNFAFLDAMCLGKSGRYVLDELLMVMSYPDILGPELMHEMDILLDTMRLSKVTMDYPHNDQPLAFEFLGRLPHLAKENPIIIKRLVEGAFQWYKETPGLYLVPQRSCFPTPGNPLRTTLTGHKNDLRDMKVNNSGNMLATASEDGTVRVWELGTDEVTHVLKLPRAGQIWSVCISSDEQWVVSSVYPDTIQVWSLKTGEPVLSIPGFYTDIAITHDSSQIVAARGCDLVAFDIISGKCLNTIQKKNGGGFKNIFITSDDKAVIAVSKVSQTGPSGDSLSPALEEATVPEEVNIWSLESSGSYLAKVAESTARGEVITITGTQQVVVGDKSGQITIAKLPASFETNGNGTLDLTTLQCQTQNGSAVTALFQTKDGNIVYGGDADGFVYAWDAENGKLKLTIDVCGCAVTGLAVTEDGRYALCGTYDGAINVMDLMTNTSTPTMVQSLKGQQAVVDKLILVGHLIITASSQSPYIKLWDISDRFVAVKPATFPCNDRLDIGNVAVTENNVYYRGSSGEKKGQFGVNVWNSETGKEKSLQLDSDGGNVQCLEVCRDRQHIIVGFKDGKVAMYNIDSGKEVGTFKHDRGEGGLSFLKLRHDEKILVAKTIGAVTMWDVDTRKCLKTWQHPDFEHLHHLTITNDADVIYADNTTNNIAKGWSALVRLGRDSKDDKLQAVKDFAPSGDSVDRIGGLALSNDNSMLALSLGSQILMLDGETYETLWTATAANDVGWCLAFTQDNSMLLAGMSGRRINLFSTWDGTIATTNIKNYIYSALVKVITTTDDYVYGVTYIGQFIVMKIHGERASLTSSMGRRLSDAVHIKRGIADPDMMPSVVEEDEGEEEGSDDSSQTESWHSVAIDTKRGTILEGDEVEETRRSRKLSSVCAVL